MGGDVRSASVPRHWAQERPDKQISGLLWALASILSKVSHEFTTFFVSNTDFIQPKSESKAARDFHFDFGIIIIFII